MVENGAREVREAIDRRERRLRRRQDSAYSAALTSSGATSAPASRSAVGRSRLRSLRPRRSCWRPCAGRRHRLRGANADQARDSPASAAFCREHANSARLCSAVRSGGQGAIIGQWAIPHGARQAPANGARGWLTLLIPTPPARHRGRRPAPRSMVSRDGPPSAWPVPRHRLRVRAAVRPVPAVLPVADGAPHHRAPGRSAGSVRSCAVSSSQRSGAVRNYPCAAPGRLWARSGPSAGRASPVARAGKSRRWFVCLAPRATPLWETRRERDLRPCAVAMPRVVVDLAEPAYIERSS